MTLEHYLEHWATATPQKVAVVTPVGQMTYKELWMLVGQRVRDFRTAGIGWGRIVPLRTQQNASFLADYCALHVVGGVPMPLEHDMPADKFNLLSQHYGQLTAPQGTADVLFNTGTTGVSKGVYISHKALMANAENLIDAHGYCQDLTFIVCGPLNHIGSLSKVWPVFVTGATLYVLEGMKDIGAFFHALDYPARLMASFLVPASLRMLLLLGARQIGEYAQKLDFIETGAAPMVQADMEKLCALLPTTRLFNTYASTETGIICTHNYNDGNSCSPRCVGRPMRHSGVTVTNEGSVVCTGATLMTGYAGDDERTAQVMTHGSVCTSDSGYIDDEGRLYLTGRTDDVINVGGYKVAPSEVEAAAMTDQSVKDCICIGVPSPLTGSALKLLVVPNDGCMLDKRKLAQHIAKRIERHKVPLLYEQVDSVRRNVNGKLERKYYFT